MSPQRSTPVNSQRAPSTASQSGVTAKRGGKRKGGQQEEAGGGKEEEEVQAQEREPGGSVGGRRCTDAGDSWGPCSSVEVVGHGQGWELKGNSRARPVAVQGWGLGHQGQWAAGVGAAGEWCVKGRGRVWREVARQCRWGCKGGGWRVRGSAAQGLGLQVVLRQGRWGASTNMLGMV